METALENEYANKLREAKFNPPNPPLQGGGGADSPLQKGGEGDLNSGDAGASWRKMKILAARQALNLKERAKEKIEEKKEQLGGYLKDRLLNFIPFYGPWKVFKAAVTGKFKTKIKLIDVIIMLFSNLEVFLIILGTLVLIVLIVDFMTAGVWEQIKTIIGGLTKLSWTGINTLFNLFAGLAK